MISDQTTLPGGRYAVFTHCFAKHFFRVLKNFSKNSGGPPAPAPTHPQFKGVFLEKQGGRFWLIAGSNTLLRQAAGGPVVPLR